MAVFTLDGRNYCVGVKSIHRSAAIKEGKNSGTAMSGAMVRDLIGTFYSYSIELDMRLLSPSDYDEFYETITAPVESHVLVVPYGQGTMRYEAYVTGAEDVCRLPANVRIWGGLKVTFYAREPQRRV